MKELAIGLVMIIYYTASKASGVCFTTCSIFTTLLNTYDLAIRDKRFISLVSVYRARHHVSRDIFWIGMASGVSSSLFWDVQPGEVVAFTLAIRRGGSYHAHESADRSSRWDQNQDRWMGDEATMHDCLFEQFLQTRSGQGK